MELPPEIEKAICELSGETIVVGDCRNIARLVAEDCAGKIQRCAKLKQTTDANGALSLAYAALDIRQRYGLDEPTGEPDEQQPDETYEEWYRRVMKGYTDNTRDDGGLPWLTAEQRHRLRRSPSTEDLDRVMNEEPCDVCGTVGGGGTVTDYERAASDVTGGGMYLPTKPCPKCGGKEKE